jgi:hypothetical protein
VPPHNKYTARKPSTNMPPADGIFRAPACPAVLSMGKKPISFESATDFNPTILVNDFISVFERILSAFQFQTDVCQTPRD